MDETRSSARIKAAAILPPENSTVVPAKRNPDISSFLIALAIYMAVFVHLFFSCLPRAPFVDQFPASMRATADKAWCLLDTDTTADIALLGSSILVYPLFLTDKQLYPNNPFYNDLGNCSYFRGCEYFKQQICRAFGKNISVENDGLSATLNTDYKNLLDIFARRKNKPKVILIFLTERDFLDMYWGPDSSYSPLSMLLDPWHAKIFLHNISRHSRQAFLQAFSAVRPFPAPANASALPPYHYKQEFLRRFLPTNYNLLEQEIKSLEITLQKARDMHIEIRIVLIPVADNFYGLIPARAKERILQSIEASCHKFQCPILDLRGIPLSPSDYRDTWHLNAAGGQKAFSYVINFVRQDKPCRKALAL